MSLQRKINRSIAARSAAIDLRLNAGRGPNPVWSMVNEVFDLARQAKPDPKEGGE